MFTDPTLQPAGDRSCGLLSPMPQSSGPDSSAKPPIDNRQYRLTVSEWRGGWRRRQRPSPESENRSSVHRRATAGLAAIAVATEDCHGGVPDVSGPGFTILTVATPARQGVILTVRF